MSTHRSPTRRLTDAVVAAAVRYEGPNGRAWATLEAEVVERCRVQLGWRTAGEAERDAVDLAVADACLWLRDTAVFGGAWRPDGGASLVGSAVRHARLRLVHHRRYIVRVRPPEELLVDDLDDVEADDDPAGTVEAAAQLDAFRAHVGESTWRLAAGQAAGWTLDELAAVHGVGVRGAATRLWRGRRSWSEHGW